MRFESIKAAMESTQRCILLFKAGSWGCTDQEGATTMLRFRKAQTALSQFTGASVIASGQEMELLGTVRQRDEEWAAEWWHGPDGEGAWLRPLVCL